MNALTIAPVFVIRVEGPGEQQLQGIPAFFQEIYL
jgi:hypothetical protein